MKCLNCYNLVEKEFCPNCGQKSSTHRFSLKYILDMAILNEYSMFDKGFLFTLKELFTRPGHGIREYIQGRRISYSNAFSLLMLLIAVVYLLDGYTGLKLADITSKNGQDFANSIDELTTNYPKLIYLINIPLMAITSYIFFRKSKVNFVENIILNTYISSAIILFSLPFILLTIFYKDKSILSIIFIQLLPLITFCYTLCVYYQFFSEYKYKKRNIIFRSLFAILISSILQGMTYMGIVGLKNIL